MFVSGTKVARDLTYPNVAGTVKHVRQNTHTQGAITARRAEQTLVATHHTHSTACVDCDKQVAAYELAGKNTGVVWSWTGRTALRWSGLSAANLRVSYELAATCRPCFTARPAYIQAQAQQAALEAASLAVYEVAASAAAKVSA